MNDADGYGPDDLLQEIDVSRETSVRLETVIGRLDHWQSKINLIGPSERAHLWRRHILDSLQLLPSIPSGSQIVDLGSGGGFPSLPLACAMPDHGGGHVTMVESVGKKCAFLRDAVVAADLPATVFQKRIESCEPAEADIVTARALAPLPRLLSLASPWLSAGAVGLFHKGERWKEELTAAATEWTFAHQVIPSRSGGAGVILRLSEVSHV